MTRKLHLKPMNHESISIEPVHLDVGFRVYKIITGVLLSGYDSYKLLRPVALWEMYFAGAGEGGLQFWQTTMRPW